MYDPETTSLIRKAPALEGLDRERLPEFFSSAFARIVSARVRLRAGQKKPNLLNKTASYTRRLAQTNEALVTILPNRDDVSSAAFVAATAHKLCYQINALQRTTTSHSYISPLGISGDVASLLLFLVGQSSADASEVAANMSWPRDVSRLENELLLLIKMLGQGQVGKITDRKRPSPDRVIAGSPGAKATSALYYRILRGVRALAFKLQGRYIKDFPLPKTIFEHVRSLAAPELESTVGDNVTRDDFGPIVVFPGPYHLATLLLAVCNALENGAVVSAPAPDGIAPKKWRKAMRNVAKDRPYLWPNHQDAISKGYLNPGISAVVGFPTGAGKSTVSQLKINSALLLGRKAVFIAPTHSLVDQTARDLRKAFPRATVRGERADELGFSTETDELPDILVMTPEACLQLTHVDSDAFEDVGLLVFDECHLLHAKQPEDRRALDAMLCLLNFVRVAPSADLVLLSAMMQNTNELAEWIAQLTERPVLPLSLGWKPTRQLRGCILYRKSELLGLNEKLKAGRRQKPKGRVPAPLGRTLKAKPLGFFSVQQTWSSVALNDYALVRFHRDKQVLATNDYWKLTPNSGVLAAAIATAAAESGVKTLVFTQDVVKAFSIAKKAAIEMPVDPIKFTSAEEKLLQIAVDELGSVERLYLPVKKGHLVATASVHHGLLLPEERHLVESLYRRKGGLTILAATPTLAQGMNLPSELVVIADDSRFDQYKDKREILAAQDLLNAAGRAGRAGQNASGLVVVIPGSIIPLENEGAPSGARWKALREVFSQSDQCLTLDDPLTAIVDRIHNEVDETGDLERYVVSRLASQQTEEGTPPISLENTFAAFRHRKKENLDWIESRTKSAYEFLGDKTDLSDEAKRVRNLSSTLGLPEDVILRLRKDVLEAKLGVNSTISDWTDWMLNWLANHPTDFLRLIRDDDLSGQFGKAYSSIESPEERVAYAIPHIRALLKAWMSGATLEEMQKTIPTSTRDKAKSVGARKFVVRRLPNITHIFGVPALIAQEANKVNDQDETAIAPALLQLRNCVRRGFDTLETAAVHTNLLPNRIHRRRVHEISRAMRAHLKDRPDAEGWEQLVIRVETAMNAETMGRG